MAALFACTKCHSRHPFEELSSSEQLCKECRNYQPVVKCTLCRAEFSPGEKGSTSSSCRHCTHSLKIYGEASVCKYCNLMAAFVDNKCKRCTEYQRKFGSPVPCEQCKMNCAFDRTEHTKRKCKRCTEYHWKFGSPVPCEQCKMNCAFDRTEHTKRKADGKTLCWLCSLAYKRVLDKARKRREEKKQKLASNRSSYDKLDKLDKADKLEKVEDMSTGSNSRQSNGGDKISPFDNNSQSAKTPQKDNKPLLNISGVGEKSTPPSFASSFSFLREHKEEKSNDSADVPVKEEPKEEKGRRSHHHHHHHHHHHKSKHHKRSHSRSDSPSKRVKVENSDSNGVTGTLTPTKSSVLAQEKSPIDPNSSEHIIAINRLQDQLDNVKKQLQTRDQQLMEKDKKITEIKAEQYEKEKLFRTKITDISKKSDESISALQLKNRELEKKNSTLTKQVQQLSKGKKASLLNSNSQSNSPNISS